MDDYRQLLIWLLRQNKECEWVEFKENFHSPEEIGESISALSNGASLHNEAHGYLVFGVKDDLTVNGTTFDLVKETRGNELVEHWIIQRLAPRIDFRIIATLVDDKRIVLFEIPAARNQPVSFLNHAYIHIASYTRKLRDFPEKERKIWSSRPDSVFAQEIALQGLHGQDVIEYLDTQTFFEMLGLPYPSNREETLNKLQQEQLIKPHQGAYAITNLGALLFAKQLHLFPSVARKATRVLVYEGKDKLKTTRDQFGKKGYAVAFAGLINYINDQLPANEEISRIIREQVTMYPKEAIREIVANALVHQDFAEFGSAPTIEIFSDRIEVTNPGLPLITTLRFIDGYLSRNEAIASRIISDTLEADLIKPEDPENKSRKYTRYVPIWA